MKTIIFDVMTEMGDRFYGSLKVKVGNIFKTRDQEVREALYERYPTLKYRRDILLIPKN